MKCSLDKELSNFLFEKPRHIHLIGVGGSGMSGLAILLLEQGHFVSGSDRGVTREIKALQRQGLVFTIPHSAQCACESELIVYSSAIREGNATFDEAKRLGKRLVRRAEVLAALMTPKKGIIVCGTHGKTTTSSMAAHVLKEGNLKPSHYVGAEIPILGSNAKWYQATDYFVAEGDESDGTLVHYSPEYALVLNIEPEHLDFYKDSVAIDAVYQQLIKQTRGSIFYYAEDEGATRVCATHPRAIAIGKKEQADYYYKNLKQQKEGSVFEVFHRGKQLGVVELKIPGVHNVNNAMLVIALACELDIPFHCIVMALKKFRGAKRRFELKYEHDGILVFDDYGHHPTEIEATLESARSIMPQEDETSLKKESTGRLILVLQPHRYSRTAAFYQDFGRVLLKADLAFVSDIYSAGEDPIAGITGKKIVDAALEQGHQSIFYEPSLNKIRQRIAPILQKGDLLLCLGAGNIIETTELLVADLTTRDQLVDLIKPGTVKLYESLSGYTTMKVGGPAQFFVEPETEEAFAKIVTMCHEKKIPLMVMGRGSNLLVRDAGISGVVARLTKGIFAQHSVEGMTITAGVGVKLKQLASLARQGGIGGFEWMEGIPGNLGGSLRMNAGAMKKQTFEQVVSVRYVNQEGNILSATPEELEIHYRNVPFFKNHYALSATLKGYPMNLEKIDEGLHLSLKHRKETQPIAASAGCIFKNPSTISAGQLVEELGLKNYAIGKARVSDVHGNFIVNEGNATAEEVLQLIHHIQEKALQKRGIRLETEVQIVGEDNSYPFK